MRNRLRIIHLMNQKNIFEKFWPLQKGYQKYYVYDMWANQSIEHSLEDYAVKMLRLIFFE